MSALQYFLIFSLPAFSLVGLGVAIPMVMVLVVAVTTVLAIDVPPHWRLFVVVITPQSRMVPA